MPPSSFVDMEGHMEHRPDANLIKYRLRAEANLSLKQLGKLLGKDPSTISMVIHGRRKSAPIMKAIFEILYQDGVDTPDTTHNRKTKNKEDAA